MESHRLGLLLIHNPERTRLCFSKLFAESFGKPSADSVNMTGSVWLFKYHDPVDTFPHGTYYISM